MGRQPGAGILLGPLATGAVTVLTGGWRAGFWLVAGASTVLAVLVAALPRDPVRADAGPRRFDTAGAGLFALGLTALLAGVTEARLGWGRPVVAGLLVVAALALVAFARVEGRRARPIVRPELFRHRPFLQSVTGAVITGLGVISVMSTLSTVVQPRFGLDGLGSAGLLAVWAGWSFVVALLARRLPAGFTGRHQLVAGLLITASGLLGMLAVHVGGWPALLPGLAVAGIGTGLVNAAMGELAVSSVPPESAAMGSGANNTARYLGAAVGIAAMTAVLGPAGRLETGLLVAAAVTAAGAAIVGLALRRG